MADKIFPPIFEAPPFFTIQPVEVSRKKQLDVWCDLVCAYCKDKRLYALDADADVESPLFVNPRINRRLDVHGIRTVLDALVARGNGDWENKKEKKRCKIIWRTPAQWADIIYNWAVECGMTDQICTVFGLLEGDESEGQEFRGLDHEILMTALDVLERKGKAQVFEGSGPEQGVKFLSV